MREGVKQNKTKEYKEKETNKYIDNSIISNITKALTRNPEKTTSGTTRFVLGAGETTTSPEFITGIGLPLKSTVKTPEGTFFLNQEEVMRNALKGTNKLIQKIIPHIPNDPLMMSFWEDQAKILFNKERREEFLKEWKKDKWALLGGYAPMLLPIITDRDATKGKIEAKKGRIQFAKDIFGKFDKGETPKTPEQKRIEQAKRYQFENIYDKFPEPEPTELNIIEKPKGFGGEPLTTKIIEKLQEAKKKIPDLKLKEIKDKIKETFTPEGDTLETNPKERQRLLNEIYDQEGIYYWWLDTRRLKERENKFLSNKNTLEEYYEKQRYYQEEALKKMIEDFSKIEVTKREPPKKDQSNVKTFKDIQKETKDKEQSQIGFKKDFAQLMTEAYMRQQKGDKKNPFIYGGKFPLSPEKKGMEVFDTGGRFPREKIDFYKKVKEEKSTQKVESPEQKRIEEAKKRRFEKIHIEGLLKEQVSKIEKKKQQAQRKTKEATKAIEKETGQQGQQLILLQETKQEAKTETQQKIKQVQELQQKLKQETKQQQRQKLKQEIETLQKTLTQQQLKTDQQLIQLLEQQQAQLQAQQQKTEQATQQKIKQALDLINETKTELLAKTYLAQQLIQDNQLELLMKTIIKTTTKPPKQLKLERQAEESFKRLTAYTPVFKLPNGQEIQGNKYLTKIGAESAGMKITDETLIKQFIINTVEAELSEITNPPKYTKKYKYKKNHNKYTEKRYYQKDHKNERNNNFNIMPYVFART